LNIGSKCLFTLNESGHVSSWQFNFHCGSEETGSCGIILIICYQFLRHLSEHGTSCVGKYWLAKAHFAKVSELTAPVFTESTGSTIDETAIAILTRQVS
jgi:hypothetical protein